MSRPKFLDCVMTPGVIRGIKERQEAYDRDPEGYERREREAQEEEERMLREEEDNKIRLDEMRDAIEEHYIKNGFC